MRAESEFVPRENNSRTPSMYQNNLQPQSLLTQQMENNNHDAPAPEFPDAVEPAPSFYVNDNKK